MSYEVSRFGAGSRSPDPIRLTQGVSYAPCAGTKADGGPRGAQAMRNSQGCIGYDPHQADTRRRRAAKGGKRGGRGHPALELANVKG